MNPLKERITTTKAITTLFMSGAVLIGFMGLNLGLSQTASAVDPPTNPQCPPNTQSFEKGTCEGPAPTLVRGCANPDQQITGNPNDPSKQKCTGGGEGANPVVLVPTCAAPFTLTDGKCLAKPGNREGQQA